MFIIEPTFQQDTDNWEGKISQIRKLVDVRFNEMIHYSKEHRREFKKQSIDMSIQQEQQRNDVLVT